VSEFLAFTLVGLFTGAAYAIAAGGLVLVYATTRVFNLAHGAFGMVMSYVFWQFSVDAGLSPWVALVLVVGVIAPLGGLAIERVLVRGLRDAPVSVSLVVTVGLFVGLLGLAQAVWPPDARAVEEFFPGEYVDVGPVSVTYHQLFTVAVAIAVAAGAWLLLERTRTGTAMRASIDDPGLLGLFGGDPNRVARLSWALGGALGALAGVLLSPLVTLDYLQLTLLVINAYTAAVIGRLRSLPLTFVGAIVLGLAQSYAVGYLPTSELFINLRTVIPAIMLFTVLVFLPGSRLTLGPIRGIPSPRVPSLPVTVVAGVALVAVVAVATSATSATWTTRIGTGLAFALIMLSLVLLTGYGGYVSLAQLTFAGLGALVVTRTGGSLWALLFAVAVTTAVGALVALPVMRLTGLYLALATFAFGQLMDRLIFQSEQFGFGFNDGKAVERLNVFGLTFGSDQAYAVLLAAVFATCAAGLLAVRRGRHGRLLVAMRDSPAACGTLGQDPKSFKVGLFAASAGLAGLGGALWAGLRQSIGASDFVVTASLPLMLLAVLCGVTTITGVLVGGFLLMLMPVIQSGDQALGGLLLVFIGLAAVSLGREPNGVVHLAATKARGLAERSGRVPPPRQPGATESPEPAETADPADPAIGAKGVTSSGVA
jgi:branched-chain amino acid transport system permease protein